MVFSYIGSLGIGVGSPELFVESFGTLKFFTIGNRVVKQWFFTGAKLGSRLREWVRVP